MEMLILAKSSEGGREALGLSSVYSKLSEFISDFMGTKFFDQKL
jgi:hypothetical protein